MGVAARLALAVCLAASPASPAAAADGWGRVFDPNPVNTLNNTGLRDGFDKDGAAFAPAYVTKRLPGLTVSDRTGRHLLRGPHVFVSDAGGSPFLFPASRGIISSGTGDFLFGRAPDQFEHVMAYYHIDANQRYIQSLGFTNANNRPTRVDPHGLSGRTLSLDAAGSPKRGASRYVPSPVGAGYLVFGVGGVDDAEDADVILHEYAHAIQDNQAPGKYLGTSGEAAAMGEGFADYWAASSTYDQSIANGFDPACIGEWNAAPGCMDRVDYTPAELHYPEDATGGAQADGRIWSSALWDLFKETGDRGATDTIVLQSHFLVPANPTFADGVQALLDADDLIYGGTHQAQICSAMAARGLPAGGCAFLATVTWDNPLVDIDLRLRPPDGAGVAGWEYANDCSSANKNPDWGVVGDPSDNPLLKIDCRYTTGTGCHEEQIVLKKFTTPGSYGVYVHYYDHSGWENQTTTVTVSVYKAGKLLFSGSRLLAMGENNLPEEGDLWKLADDTVTFP